MPDPSLRLDVGQWATENRSALLRWKRWVYLIIAIAWIPAFWLLVKHGFGVSDRYFPHPLTVVEAIGRLDVTLALHSVVSVSRLIVGYSLGCLAGVLLGIYLYKYRPLEDMLAPGVHAIRAVPATATVPFFILWFGFAEHGKVLIIVIGISLNFAISVLQILHNMPEKYQIAFRGYHRFDD